MSTTTTAPPMCTSKDVSSSISNDNSYSNPPSMTTMTVSTTTTTTSATKSYLQRGETLVAAETSKSEIVDLREQKAMFIRSWPSTFIVKAFPTCRGYILKPRANIESRFRFCTVISVICACSFIHALFVPLGFVIKFLVRRM